MQRMKTGVVLLLAMLGTLAVGNGARARDMGPGTVVGRVSDRSSKVKGRRLQVRAGDKKWTLHLAGTTVVYHNRRKVSIHKVDLGMWVKASGTRIGRLRLDVDRLDIAGDRAAYLKSDAYQRRQPEGYFVPRRFDR